MTVFLRKPRNAHLTMSRLPCRASIWAQACQMPCRPAPRKVRVASSNHLRASLVSPISPANTATDWNRKGLGAPAVLRMPFSHRSLARNRFP